LRASYIYIFEATHFFLKLLFTQAIFFNNFEILNSGMHRLAVDGKSADNQQVSTGIYHFRITVNDTAFMRKIVYSK